ncbi:shufflon system plasmid conjugative transfer pilus tip adhesin PilV [Trinickia diaoshuihuensis]|uniref:shufflon system plasmid conjugative transfer pilus tip adhesin PilV n=1 Tax=Trinickia diaoshuihuensis TaxID=2292265 RepID=UPI000E2279C1|nr:shufflon system plasmid conjugative transfer pilus tip adhesin PilV [Trinickia diaoshuihuensis]
MDAIVGYMIALTLSMMAVAGFTTWARQGVANVVTAATASQMVIFDRAAQQYVQDHAADLAIGATATTPVTVTAGMLGQYLPNGFSAKNPFGQIWQLQVLQPSPGQLQPLVTSQLGRPITDTKQLVQIAAQAGAAGGFVPYANQGGDAAMNPTKASGAYGGWSVPLGSYTNPGSGHLASLLAFTNPQSMNNYLYRVAVPTQPQLNQMQTALDMGSHDVNNADNVTASGVSIQNPNGNSTLLLGQQASVAGNDAYQQIYMHANNGVVVTNAAGNAYEGITSGWANVQNANHFPTITLGNSSIANDDAHQQLTLHADGQTVVTNNAGTAYAPFIAGSVTSTGDMSSGGNVVVNGNISGKGVVNGGYLQPTALAVAGTTCTNSGEIANSGNGPLFCQSGVWQTAGGPRIHFDQVTYQYVGDGGTCPPNTVAIGAGGWYMTYTAGYLYCAQYY